MVNRKKVLSIINNIVDVVIKLIKRNMITETDLYNLDYNKKQDVDFGKNKTKDFRYDDPGTRDYLVNLSDDGIITIIYPINYRGIKRPVIRDLDIFTDWHNSQKNVEK